MEASIACKNTSKTAQIPAPIQKLADGEMKEKAGRRKLRESAPEIAFTARYEIFRKFISNSHAKCNLSGIQNVSLL